MAKYGKFSNERSQVLGTPCVVTNVGDTRNCKNGWVVPPNKRIIKGN